MNLVSIVLLYLYQSSVAELFSRGCTIPEIPLVGFEIEVMVAKTLIRKGFMLGARYSGVSGALSPWLAGCGAILMLHRIAPCKDDLCINGFLSVEAGFLDRMLENMKKDGYRFCPMDEVVDRLRAGHKDERFIAVTLDDGYKDNLVAGAPVFESHDVPYTIYVCPGFVEGYAHLWWENLADLIEARDEIIFYTEHGKTRIECMSFSQKRGAYARLLKYLTHDVDEIRQREFVDDLCAAYGMDPKAHVKSQIMSWEDLRQLNRSPLCTLGAHTLNHYHLARLGAEDAAFEMEQSGRVLALELGEMPRHFAYPYGAPIAVGQREVDMARQLGYQTAVTTRHGTLHPRHVDTAHALPRISVNGNYQHMVYVRTLLSGFATPFANGGRRVVTV